MTNLHTLQQDVAILSPDAQQIIFGLVELLKKQTPVQQEGSGEGWSDFIGCIEAEEDLSANHKLYLAQELDEKYGNR